MPLEASQWSTSFRELLQRDRHRARALRESALAENLKSWTTALTGLVADSLQGLGLDVAARGHRCRSLPVNRAEYLALDVIGLPAGDAVAWRFPLAAFELENSARVASIEYALWKLLCVRDVLRVVFGYRSERAEAPALVSGLASSVVAAMPTRQRASMHGDTLVFVGSRNDAGTFPYGFFRAWQLNYNTGRFEVFTWH